MTSDSLVFIRKSEHEIYKPFGHSSHDSAYLQFGQDRYLAYSCNQTTYQGCNETGNLLFFNNYYPSY